MERFYIQECCGASGIIDTSNNKLEGFSHFEYEENDYLTKCRIYVRKSDVEMLNAGINKCTYPEAVNYSYDLSKILFFEYLHNVSFPSWQSIASDSTGGN